ncbi:DUF4439 domain-containing protein [Aeromicrobium sp. UC242_57]|uniref:DUF4439 domain-containing protein n=1 Tax=Aeromicrobium sp. UC242_57 TaxID=3374624 RepID=UPI0037A1EE88
MSTVSTGDDLNAWLALEHEAVWLYPVIGAPFDGLRARANQSFEAHRDTRDALLARLDRLGVEPVSTALSYRTHALKNVASARRAARDIESRISAACLQVAGRSDADTRTFAVKSSRRPPSPTWPGERVPKPSPVCPDRRPTSP